MKKRARYGIDAPRVVVCLLLMALLSSCITACSYFIENRMTFWIFLLYMSAISLLFAISAAWMLYSSLVLKPRIAHSLIKELDLKGDESLLDMGCGRGLFLIEAARQLVAAQLVAARLATQLKSRVDGIDLWTLDQSGNSREALMDNARAEGLSYIQIATGDMRLLPYADATFDLVISSLAIHNIPTREGRDQALEQMLRVLKPGGKFCLLDFHYIDQYEEYFRQKGIQLQLSTRYWSYLPPLRSLTGSKSMR